MTHGKHGPALVSGQEPPQQRDPAPYLYPLYGLSGRSTAHGVPLEILHQPCQAWTFGAGWQHLSVEEASTLLRFKGGRPGSKFQGVSNRSKSQDQMLLTRAFSLHNSGGCQYQNIHGALLLRAWLLTLPAHGEKWQGQ